MSDAVRTYAQAGAAQIAAGNYQAAQESYEQALLLSADTPILHYGHGLALQNLKQYQAAIAAYDKVIALYPTMAYAHLAKAQCALRVGDFARGWPAYEWRIQFDEVPPNPYYKFSPPTWTLATLKGKHVLLWSEQGFGDMLQFFRFVPLVASQCEKVYLAMPPLLQSLFQDSLELSNVVFVSSLESIPPYDEHGSLMSLPLACGIDHFDKIPKPAYLCANPKKKAFWAKRIAAQADSGLRVGLVWAGGSRLHNAEAVAIDARRSLTLAALSPLSAVNNVKFFSLQKDEPSAQIHSLKSDVWQGEPLIDWTSDLHDWADTAALVANLDVVITCCTAVAHLAAAMGKPTWILLHEPACWRWLEHRDDSPWYPSARLFRQKEAGNWNEVIDRVSFTLGHY